jgi:hypothetical protein
LKEVDACGRIPFVNPIFLNPREPFLGACDQHWQASGFKFAPVSARATSLFKTLTKEGTSRVSRGDLSAAAFFPHQR